MAGRGCCNRFFATCALWSRKGSGTVRGALTVSLAGNRSTALLNVPKTSKHIDVLVISLGMKNTKVMFAAKSCCDDVSMDVTLDEAEKNM